MLAAVNVNFRPVQVTRLVRAQKIDGIGNFIGQTESRMGISGIMYISVSGERISVLISPER